eukprot:3649435-Pleurochrysis_carterae.AAC.1
MLLQERSDRQEVSRAPCALEMERRQADQLVLRADQIRAHAARRSYSAAQRTPGSGAVGRHVDKTQARR